jgi:hypothetical protein
MAQAVAHQFNIITATPNDKVRRPSAGDLGRRQQTATLAAVIWVCPTSRHSFCCPSCVKPWQKK